NAFSDPDHVPVGDTIIIPSPSLWPWYGPSDTAAMAVAEATEEAEDSESEEEEAEVLSTDDGDSTDDDAEGAEAEATEAPTAEPTATSMPQSQPAAAAQRSTSSTASNPSVAAVREQFAAGYAAAGGPAQYLDHILNRVIGCESGFNVRAYNPAGPFYGLMQFLPQTWANTGGGDWFDAWQQGHNTGVLLKSSTPQSQW